MAIFKKQVRARGVLLLVATVLISISFVTSRHLVPQGLRQVITLDHQIRRVLLRAERETLKTGVSINKAPLMIHLLRELGEAPRFSENVLTYYKISPTLIEPKNLLHKLSPVLNI